MKLLLVCACVLTIAVAKSIISPARARQLRLEHCVKQLQNRVAELEIQSKGRTYNDNDEGNMEKVIAKANRRLEQVEHAVKRLFRTDAHSSRAWHAGYKRVMHRINSQQADVKKMGAHLKEYVSKRIAGLAEMHKHKHYRKTTAVKRIINKVKKPKRYNNDDNDDEKHRNILRKKYFKKVTQWNGKKNAERDVEENDDEEKEEEEEEEEEEEANEEEEKELDEEAEKEGRKDVIRQQPGQGGNMHWGAATAWFMMQTPEMQKHLKMLSSKNAVLANRMRQSIIAMINRRNNNMQARHSKPPMAVDPVERNYPKESPMAVDPIERNYPKKPPMAVDPVEPNYPMEPPMAVDPVEPKYAEPEMRIDPVGSVIKDRMY